MSTKLMKADGKQNGTVNREEKSGLTSGSCQPQGQTAQPKPPAGSQGIPAMPVMTQEETANLLARLQDILSLWRGSDNKIIGHYVMTAFPIPEGVSIGKMTAKNGGKVFCVNAEPVVSLGHDTPADVMTAKKDK